MEGGVDGQKIQQTDEIIADDLRLPMPSRIPCNARGFGHADEACPSFLRYHLSVIKRFARIIPVLRRYRPIVSVLLALLLVFMQQGAQLHALEHDNARLHRAHDAGMQAPGDDAVCAMCALFAGGAGAAAAEAPTLPAPVADFSPPSRAIALVAIASPSPYQSRAPPSIL